MTSEHLAVSDDVAVGLIGVCAIGASAGGLEPLETFFGSVPTDTGLAFVVIQHLSPDHESMMDSLLSRHTSMSVRQANDGDELLPDRVYLIPPDRVLTVEGKRLLLSDRDRSAATNASPHPIDAFFRSLADEWGADAAAVVLSGTGNDGAAGTEAVRRAGGLTLAQDASASFEGMPSAAQKRGFIDAVSSVPAMVTHVVDFFHSGKRPAANALDSRYTPVEESIIADLASSTGINFRDYKRGTVRRRIEHRMNVTGAASITDLAERVRSSVDERVALTRDILIGVTSFFRDPEVYESLRSPVQDIVATAHAEERSARAWVVGCATGQEAYSLAILMVEARDLLGVDVPIQVFATDVHEEALAAATEGVFSDAEMEGVSPERRLRFFRTHPDGWRVRDELRGAVTFARHNMLTDTPFSRIDLVSCRNTLIYFTPTAQQRALWALGFALRHDGTLLLGASESPGFLVPDFEPVSAADRIFQKTGDSAIKSFRRRMGPELIGASSSTGITVPRVATGPDQALLRAYDLILDQHFVGGLIVDNRNEIIHVVGNAKNWLEHGTGRPTFDVHALVEDPALRLAIGSLLRDLAEPDSGEVQRLVTIDDAPALLRGRTIRSAGSSYRFISAQPVDVPVDISNDLVSGFDAADLDRIGQLESDLAYTRESLQAALEEQETSNEELNAANEELIASNEELQSSNEELSALNEELRTLNDEHHRRLQEVLELTADLEQILTATEIGIVLLDADRNIRRFSDPARDFFHLMASDQGRPFEHIRSRFDAPDFEVAVEEALVNHASSTLRGTLGPDTDEVLVRVRPYSLPHEETGVSITTMHLGAAAQSRREALLSAVIESSPLRIYAFDEDLICQFASGEFAGERIRFEGMSANQITDIIGGTSREMMDMFNDVRQNGGTRAGVFHAPDGQQAAIVWRFENQTGRFIGALAASMEALQSTTGDWVESQTLSVLANLLGVGAAVIAGDGTVGERFSAQVDDPDVTPPLDQPENLLALSNLVASSAELEFDEIDQTVDMFVSGQSTTVHVRGLRLGRDQTSPYLVIAFAPD